MAKWNYDIFGETLEHALLMESQSLPGIITISGSVHATVARVCFVCESVCVRE